MTYVHTLKRIRQDKTNYHKRAAILIGRRSFATVKVSGQNVAAQVLKPTKTGDIVLASAHSRQLAKQGWKGSFNSLPACYLTGLLLGKKALGNGVKDAVLYIGKDHYTSRVAACLKGIVDSGVAMPVDMESLPDEERITGQHIADYATTLKQESQDEYNSRFSAIIKGGLNPEDYPSHFEEIKTKLTGKASEPKPKKTAATEEKEAAAPAKEEKKKATPKEKKEKEDKPKKDDKKSKAKAEKGKKSKGGKKK